MSSSRPFNTDICAQKGCPHCSAPLPHTIHVPAKKKWLEELKPATIFTIGGQRGVPLKPNAAEASWPIDNAGEPVFSGCGPKVTFVIRLDGYQTFKLQKRAYTWPGGQQIPNTRAKVVTQIAEVMAAFMENKVPDGPNDMFRDDGITLDDLVLYELHHVAKSSFQPIFGRRCRCPPMPTFAPMSSVDMLNTQVWHDEFFWDGTLGDPGTSYVNTQPYTLLAPVIQGANDADELALWLQDLMSMGN